MRQEIWVDLHVHTYYSDGLLSPAEVVAFAKRAGVSGLGIVDHDTVDGIEEAKHAGQKHGVEIVPGVELSSQRFGRDIHILGYYFDRSNKKLIEYLELFRTERYKRAEKMVSNLNKAGVGISMDEVVKKATSSCIARPHIAEILMEKGYVETFQEAFYKYIGYGSSAYVDKYRISPEEAIALIADAKGLSFLAHPGPLIDDRMILNMIKAGLDGIEILHPKLFPERTQKLQRIAQNHGLLVSGGSDCHGGRNGDMGIGKHNVPFVVLDEIKCAYAARYGHL